MQEQYYIPGTGDTPNTPWYSVESAAGIAGCIPLQVDTDWTGTSSDKKTIYEANGGSVKTFMAGTYQDAENTGMTGSDTPIGGIIYVGNVSHCYIMGISLPASPEGYYDHKVFALCRNDMASAMDDIVNNRVTYNEMLYQKTEMSEYPSFVEMEEVRDWDDSPSTDPENDPFNELPQGGAFADTESFSSTFMQYLDDLLEPETLDYGKFLTAYQLDAGNLADLGLNLFAPNFWTSLKNKFEGLSDPMSFIISAVEIPFTLGAVPTTFKIGGVEVEDDNNQPIYCSKHTERYVKYDFGSISMKEVWGTAKDYTDCSISVFLPYVGMREIDTELGINASLKLAVIVDVWTGDLNYMLEVNNSASVNKYFSSSGVPYHWSGNCGNRIPIGKVDPSSPILNVAASLGSMAMGVGMMFAGGIGGAAAAEAGGMVTAGSAVSAGAGGAMIAGGGKSLLQNFNKGFSPLAQSSGNISGAIGYMDFQYPYVVIKRGVPAYPNNWREHLGAPRFQTFQLSALNGLTVFSEIRLESLVGITQEEILQLKKELTTEGIIL